MAPNRITLSLLVFLATFTYSNAKLRPLKELEMTLYFQDYVGNFTPTVIEIPGPSTPPYNFTKFGALFVLDDPLTLEMEESSTPIARGQGMYLISSLNGTHSHTLMSVVFIATHYKGSTLEIQGSYPQFEPSWEVAVVGGTGKFRMARGYAIFEVVSTDPAREYYLMRCNLTVVHY